MARFRPTAPPLSCDNMRIARSTPTSILSEREMRAIHYATGQAISIRIEGGIIQSIDPHEAGDFPFVAPGLIDLQINGYAGHDINSLPLGDDDTLGNMIRALWREGVTSCYPTVITNTPDAIAAAMQTIARSCERDRDAARGVAGIHLEGPFVSPDDGARGAHSPAHVRPPAWDPLRPWQEPSSY